MMRPLWGDGAMIEAECPNCHAKLQVPEQYAGRTGKCKGCGAAVTVPARESEQAEDESGGWALQEMESSAPAPPPPMPMAPPAQPTAYPPGYQAPAPSSGGLDGLIPTKNPCALIAYYLGVFSLIPCLGLVLAIPALILGIKGVKFVSQYPEAKGRIHAWVGVIMGGLFTLIWGGLLIMGLVSALVHP
jgi:hypothetical protein